MRGLNNFLVNAALLLSLALASHAAWALKCDVDNNGRIDRIDLGLIQQAVLAQSPVTGPDDPRDADNNFVINSADGRVCALRCKYAACATNGAPLANAGPDQTVRVNDTVALNGAASSDPDGNALSYSWAFTSRPAGSAAVLSGAAAVNPSFVADRPGTYELRLVVNDGTVNSAPDTVRINTTNTAPVANAGPDQTAVVGATVGLSGAASSDADGNALSYRWTLAGPAGSAAALVGANTVTPSFVVDQQGNYLATLIVNDGSVDSPPDTVVVSTTNSSPTANAGPDQTVRVTETVTLSGAASSDPDGDPLTRRPLATTPTRG
jgi:hypothetical protein